MANKELVKYIRKYQNQGIPEEILEKNLIEGGWPEEEVKKAIKSCKLKKLPSWVLILIMVIAAIVIFILFWQMLLI